MNLPYPFTIYNASAGAGKTYTLVKSYLITLLRGEYKESYKNILAITFTNKAVGEMKTRVLASLEGISEEPTTSSYQELLNDIVSETGLDLLLVKRKAARILKSILHNYAGFDIVTIDTFTHRVIRTFAKDLGIPMNFEIEMDAEALIQESVDSLMTKVGSDEDLTKIIIDFALSKLEDDKSWDITLELNKTAKLLLSENDRNHLTKLLDKTPNDFHQLKAILKDRINHSKKKISIASKEILDIIDKNGIAETDFTRGSIPAHFRKLATVGSTDYKAGWKQNIETTSFYASKTEAVVKEKIDSIRPEIELAFKETRKWVGEYKFEENILKNLIPLSVLYAINNELHALMREKGILLISEFNKIISEAIRDQPAPFIYERLGERYRDYFIDEFQDTSELQWNNLIPLIDNALSTETLTGKRGRLTIVGDAKQAIYRWRGGKAEQFIELTMGQNPFSIEEKEVTTLPKNYRSYKEIIVFNNSFFTHLSGDFSNETHQQLYELGNQQQYNAKEGGYVNISFIEAKTVEEENEIYPQRAHEIILDLKSNGYKLSDICILTRKQNEGSKIADFLSEKGIPIISSESLLLKNDPRVCFVIDLLTWHSYPEDLEAKTRMLHYLAEKFSLSDKHAFLSEMVFASKDSLMLALRARNIVFNFNELNVKPFYEVVEYCIGIFGLADTTPAYLQFFMDTVFSYTQKHVDGVIGFLEFWEKKKDNLSIVASDGEDAVQIMTIHKSKGLEFRCVIYPYANINMYAEIEPKTWMPVAAKTYHGFEEVFVSYTKELSELGASAEDMIIQRQSQLELDALNLLYVALTRAEEVLYIISKLEISSKGESNPNKFSGKLIHYLQYLGRWSEAENSYSFGVLDKNTELKMAKTAEFKKSQLLSFDPWQQKYNVRIVTNSGKLWDTNHGNAIERGNLIHDLMASVYNDKDVELVVEKAFNIGQITLSEKEVLQREIMKVIEHSNVSKYYSDDYLIINERDIFSEGKMYRPDRIVVDKNKEVTLIDYKTGKFKPLHSRQLEEYAEVLKKMHYQIGEKILIYFDEELYLKYV